MRRVSLPDVTPQFTNGDAGALPLCKNEGPKGIDSILAIVDPDIGQTITWTVAVSPLHGTVSGSYSAISTGGVVTPVGLTYAPAAGFTGSDVFTIHVSDGINGVSNIISVMVDTCGTILGVRDTENDGAGDINIFPNPAQGMFTFSIPSPLNADAAILITDITGRRILDLMAATNHPTQIQLNTKGVYFVSATVSDHRLTTKRIVVW